jgi:uncharacterized membrane protein YphA (DoxX/SURF4 family)
MQKYLQLANRILLGLLMLVPGLMKLFVSGSDGVVGMLSGITLFAWAPVFWAWALMLSEVIFGLAVLANFRLKYTVIPPVIILLVAALTVNIGNAASLLLHLVAVSGYLMLAYRE